MTTAEPVRCEWPGDDPLMLDYHDREWGVPEHDDRALFEFLTLEGAQAGLSWRTILRRREGYRAAFDGFDCERVAGYDDAAVARLLSDEGIIRNRAKVHAAIGNARALIAVAGEWAPSTASSGRSSTRRPGATASARSTRYRPRPSSRAR